MIGLTEAQRELLAFIDTYQNENDGRSPSFEEMKQGVGLASKSGVHRLICALVEKGRLRRLPNRARALEILLEDAESVIEKLPTALLVKELARRSAINRKAA